MNAIERIKLFLGYGAVCTLIGCGPSHVTDAHRETTLPAIFPDYIGVTIPTDIAPLNFCPADSSVVAIDVTLTGARSGRLHTSGKDVTHLSPKAWKELLAANAGDSLSLTVRLQNAQGAWTEYLPFGIHISTDSIDYGLVYRLIAPGYEVFSHMGIYERELASYREQALLENTQVNGCMNCHSFNRCDPRDLSLHIRGSHGGTVLRKEGQTTVYNTATDSTLNACVYPYWHPTGNYIAYSTNNTRQGFHVTAEKRVEVFDLASDLHVYDIERNELLASHLLRRDSVWETFPAFSPDGKWLYFCAAQARSIPREVKEVRYNLCRIAFDATQGQFGDRIDTLVYAEKQGKSVSFPRPSFDGRYLMYTLSDYGNFSVWHPESDLWLLDLATKESTCLSGVNSPDADSYHNWSSNSRWFVFGSRRDDGLHTRAYLCHFGNDGKAGKPFLLPQKHPRRFYDEQFRSYNIPEFVTGPVELDRMSTGKRITDSQRKAVGFRNTDKMTVPK